MRYFFDTEFQDTPWKLELLSIGVVAEDGREFYAATREVNGNNYDLNDWIRENVIPRLQPKRYPISVAMAAGEIREDLLAFIGEDPKPIFWAYYGAFDWVALCWLMGGMMNLPKTWYWICQDLRTELDRAGCQEVRDDGRDDEHNALADARWVRDTWRCCLTKAPTP